MLKRKREEDSESELLAHTHTHTALRVQVAPLTGVHAVLLPKQGSGSAYTNRQSATGAALCHVLADYAATAVPPAATQASWYSNGA